MNIQKIYWCEEAGAVYWLNGDALMYAPANKDNTADLDHGGTVETWEDCAVTEEHVRGQLSGS